MRKAKPKKRVILPDPVFNDQKHFHEAARLYVNDWIRSQAKKANKPREIQIGLPSEDVTVYENGLPAVSPTTLTWEKPLIAPENLQTSSEKFLLRASLRSCFYTVICLFLILEK